jgi:hypothetical protein
MKSLAEIEAFHREWVGTESHKRFVKWYSTIGIQMNVQGICHDHLCAGIWRGVEKAILEEAQLLLEENKKKELDAK